MLSCTKQEHTRRLAHIVHSPACCLATPALCPSTQLPAHLFNPLPPLPNMYPYGCMPLSSPLYCLPPSCLICAGLSSVLSLI